MFRKMPQNIIEYFRVKNLIESYNFLIINWYTVRNSYMFSYHEQEPFVEKFLCETLKVISITSGTFLFNSLTYIYKCFFHIPVLRVLLGHPFHFENHQLAPVTKTPSEYFDNCGHIFQIKYIFIIF